MAAERITIDSEHRDRKEYRQLVLSKYTRFTLVGIFVLLSGVSYFIYEDLCVNGLPQLSIVFRLLPAGAALVLLAAILSPLRSRTGLVIVLYYFCLGCLMAMMAGLIVITSRTANYQLYVYGTVVVVFCVYLCSLFGMKYLLPVYGIPMAAAVLFLLLDPAVTLGRIMILSNPLATSLACLILAETGSRIRYREFLSGKIIETQNAMLNNELMLAGSVQRNMIPSSTPSLRDVDIDAIYSPMIGIGGDLYDYIECGVPDTVGIFVCDVSGHGVSAALISSMVKANLNAIRGTDPSPRWLLQYLNERLVNQIGQYFVTAFYGRLSAGEKRFTYCRGGHNSPLLVRGGTVIELRGKGRMLGVVKDLGFEEIELDLKKDDRLVLYTDGLIEARNDAGELFGEARLVDVIVKSLHMENAGFVEAVYRAARDFQNRQMFQDDVCIISIHIR
ncbi:MAG: serine/threonine-protein phosphatase [Spirochaetes bacterium]|nr:serine/threonine-protein phosphatase [Spirochaetota bacterium]